jgi:hypothetical protein
LIMSLPASDRLLLALYPENSYAWASEGGRDLRAVARRRSVSVEVGRFAGAAGEALVEAGLARWQEAGPSGRARLVLTQEGRERAALTQGVQGVEPVRAMKGRLRREGALLIDDSESPLAWLARRRDREGAPLLAPELFQAGERLRRDYDLARTLPSITVRWDAVATDRHAQAQAMPISEQSLAARQRIDRAMDEVGPEFAGLLFDICACLKGLETIEAERRWPRRSARVVLDLALTKLARHYGLFTRARKVPMRHWGAEDYRPALTL